ncbi:class I lanthipeptide [Flavobacterium amniphilum]|uniref:class I lanthipeptide n=1 Tax=Flavobacterium amniphilum TaxID=1834035 RepID=UPI00202A1A9C|nr:class I lanthipeptide [Flavobacterium amniphilum]MCL9807405.1 class I lanthipeptide [Flavobacterium amniphilum]
MKTDKQNSKLWFGKTVVAELNESQLMGVNGGADGSIDWPSTGCLCTLITRTIKQTAQ